MNVKTEVLTAEIQKIYDRDGCVTAKVVVIEATPEDSPIHSLFEWNNDVCGARWREHQARNLIPRVKVIADGEPQRLINVPRLKPVDDDSKAGEYFPPSVIVKNVDAYDRACEQFLSQISGLQLAYAELQRHAKGDDHLESLSLLRTALSTVEHLSKAMLH